MFGLSRALQVWVHTEPTDMRKSFNTLSALVSQEMHREVLSGDLFVFISKDRKRMKILHFDGTGLIVWAKRLERGRFAPLYRKKREGGLELTPSECALLLEGSEGVGRYGLSPPLLQHRDLSSRMKR
ncbi:MAG: IS66 family insertion sequence element accessory protein TnpB [Myxococcales bacterium]|nr:IS66 family insertion sequence element accessory protein TnpB [Myxococcales bacterium]